MHERSLRNWQYAIRESDSGPRQNGFSKFPNRRRWIFPCHPKSEVGQQEQERRRGDWFLRSPLRGARAFRLTNRQTVGKCDGVHVDAPLAFADKGNGAGHGAASRNFNCDVDKPSQACTAASEAYRRRLASRPSSPEPSVENLPCRSRRPSCVICEGSGCNQCALQEPCLRSGPSLCLWSSTVVNHGLELSRSPPHKRF